MNTTAAVGQTMPWWKEPTRDQWRAYIAAWLGWTLDSFDFTVFLLIMLPISQEFGVPLTAVTAVFTVTLFVRFAGGLASGWIADRIGRRTPMMISFVWFSVCNFIAGFSPTFSFLFFFRALLGVGLGAEWSAGSALAMESWPTRSRGLMGALLMGSWGLGFALSSAAYGLLYPLIGWRGLLMIGILPALAVVWVRYYVKEPEIWSENRRQQSELQAHVRAPLLVIFRRQHLANTLTACWYAVAIFCTYYSIWGLFSTYLQKSLGWTSAMVAAPLFWANMALLVGAALWGVASDRIGRRAAIIMPAVIGILLCPVYLLSTDPLWISAGFIVQGVFGGAMGALAISYLTERFPTEVRATAAGFTYHLGGIFGGLTVPVLSYLAVELGFGFPMPLLAGTTLSLVAVIGAALCGPETKGRVLTGDLQTR